jgi:hypothetical protein
MKVVLRHRVKDDSNVILIDESLYFEPQMLEIDKSDETHDGQEFTE